MDFRTHNDHKWRRFATALSLAYALASIWSFSTSSFGKEVISSMVGEPSLMEEFTATVQQSITVRDLLAKYDEAYKKRNENIKILLVPGHEPTYGGTKFGDVWERDINVELAKELKKLLDENSRYEVYISRDESNWSDWLTDLYEKRLNDVEDFIKNEKEEVVRLVNTGEIQDPQKTNYHNTAPRDVAVRLYGINMWANENDMDIVIHIHWNDYPRSSMKSAGKYNGFVIFVPNQEYSSGIATKAVADAVQKRLGKYHPESNMPREVDGVVESSELIAVGSNNSVDSVSMLIEYGYIYEPQIQDKGARRYVIQDQALQTYLGLQDFFGGKNDVTMRFDSLVLPHLFKKDFGFKDSAGVFNLETFALQTVLINEGLYPPAGKTLNDCPRTGMLGSCTRTALANFQDKYGIDGELDTVGPKTREALNLKYSADIF